jgi:uncharacterized protein (TIGR01777 family)
MGVFVRSVSFDQSRAELSRWHLRSTALLRLVPAWSGVRVVSLPEALEDGAKVELDVPIPPFRRKRWHSLIEDVSDDGFFDVQEAGPFKAWRHHHRLLEKPGGTSRLEDHVEFEFAEPWPLSAIGRRVLDAGLIRTFAWRHLRTGNDLQRHHETGWAARRVLVTGSSGLVGQALCAFLETGGYEVRRLVRRAPRPGGREFAWDPARGELDRTALEGVDAIVHLAGAGVADKRWTAERMALIRDSRVESTRLLADAIAEMGSDAPALVAASAVGFYGDRPGDEVDEASAPGDGFLSRTCVEWEAAADPVRAAGGRAVHLRIGVVVAGGGGALAKLRRPVLLGVAGPIGSGRQGMSWIALDDLLAIIQHAIVDERFEGPVNAVAPEPIDNRGFMKSMGRVLRRPTIAPMPAFAARMLFGQMGEEALLQGAFVVPRRLRDLDFRYDFPELDDALRFELGRFA